jgi:hypothetical protein
MMLLNPFLAVNGGSGGGGSSDPSFGSVSLLLPFNGSNNDTTTSDLSSSPATVTLRNGAKLSTTRIKFGTTSLFLDGSNDDVITGRTCTIGTGEFTIEAHVRPNANVAGRVLSCQDSSSSNAVVCLRVDDDGALTYIHRSSGATGTVVLSSAAGLIARDDSAWYHIAATRNSSNVITLWIDGVSVATTTSGTNPNGPANFTIGSQYGLAEFFSGYIDNVRLTVGVCRYTGTFTPPSAEYPTS